MTPRRADMTVEIVEPPEADYKVQVVGDQVLTVTPADAGKVVTAQPDGTLALDDPSSSGTSSSPFPEPDPGPFTFTFTEDDLVDASESGWFGTNPITARVFEWTPAISGVAQLVVPGADPDAAFGVEADVFDGATDPLTDPDVDRPTSVYKYGPISGIEVVGGHLYKIVVLDGSWDDSGVGKEVDMEPLWASLQALGGVPVIAPSDGSLVAVLNGQLVSAASLNDGLAGGLIAGNPYGNNTEYLTGTGEADLNGNISLTIAGPPIVVPAGGKVASGMSLSALSGVAVKLFNMRVVVCNRAGTERLELGGASIGQMGEIGPQVRFFDDDDLVPNELQLVGTDLVFSGDSITSTAGGIFDVWFQAQGSLVP